MSTQALIEDPVPAAHTAPAWPLPQRIAFRFCFVYFTLFALLTQILPSVFPNPWIDIADPGSYPPFRYVVIWAAKHVFGVTTEVVYSGSGSGDKTFDWVLCFCLLVVAAVAAALWSVLDRRREGYPVLARWFRLFIRLALGSQMLAYGFAKAPPLQMSLPHLTQQLEPFGHMSPMGILWSSIGASPAYEIFAGCAELLGGVLLIFPRTVMLGALVCLADMIQIFMLNMTYDVPVKLFSFHLILLALVLLAADARRLADFFLLRRAAEPPNSDTLFASRRANWIAGACVAALWLWMIGNNIYGAWTGWHEFGGGSPKSPLYGIWDVDEQAIDGQSHPPLLGDAARFRRAIFDNPQYMSFTRMDDSFVGYAASIDTQKKTLALTKNSDRNSKATLTFDRPQPDRLVLDGQMDGHKVHIQLSAEDRKKFLFDSRGFHWIQEYPFNR